MLSMWTEAGRLSLLHAQNCHCEPPSQQIDCAQRRWRASQADPCASCASRAYRRNSTLAFRLRARVCPARARPHSPPAPARRGRRRSTNLGESALGLHIGRHTAGLAREQYDIIVVGESTLFWLTDAGLVRAQASPPPLLSVALSLSLPPLSAYIHTYMYIHTYTHTYTYICVFM